MSEPDPPKPIIVEATGTATGTSSAYGAVRLFTKLPDEHPFYNMVGRVASEWAHLEHILDLTIWKLLSWKTTGITDPLIASVTSQILGVRPRVNAISALAVARGLPDNVIKPFRKLAQDSFLVGDWRARWVHDPWYGEYTFTDDDNLSTAKVAQFRAMPPVDPRFGIQAIQDSEIEDTITRIRALGNEASRASAALFFALGSSEQTPA